MHPFRSRAVALLLTSLLAAGLLPGVVAPAIGASAPSVAWPTRRTGPILGALPVRRDFAWREPAGVTSRTVSLVRGALPADGRCVSATTSEPLVAGENVTAIDAAGARGVRIDAYLACYRLEVAWTASVGGAPTTTTAVSRWLITGADPAAASGDPNGPALRWSWPSAAGCADEACRIASPPGRRLVSWTAAARGGKIARRTLTPYTYQLPAGADAVPASCPVAHEEYAAGAAQPLRRNRASVRLTAGSGCRFWRLRASDSFGRTSFADSGIVVVGVAGASPSPTSSASPTASASSSATASPTPRLTASPTPRPTASPTPRPTASPTPGPSPAPSTSPAPGDTVAPGVTLIVNQGAGGSTEDPRLDLAIAASDESGGPLLMRIDLVGPDGLTRTGVTSDGAFVPYASRATALIPPGAPYGAWTVQALVADPSGNRGAAGAALTYLFADRSTMALTPVYEINAALDYAAGSLRASERVTVHNGHSVPIGYLDFSVLARYFGEMTVGTVSADGRTTTPSYPSSSNLRVPLGTNLLPGASATVEIAWTATASADIADSLRGRFSKANGLMQISSWHPLLSNGHALRYPGDSQYSVAADYSATITHPASVALAAPGEVTTSISGASATTQITLAGARELAFGASDAFVSESGTTSTLSYGGRPITVVAYGLSGVAGASAVTVALAAIDAYTTRYGAYPYERFVIAQSPRSTSGNEYPGIIFLGSPYFADRYVVTHETAHQWFYGIVGNDQLGAPWLDEGFTEYIGRRQSGNAVSTTSCSPYTVDRPVTAWPNSPATSACDGYNETVYFKTAAMLANLETQMGAEALTAALRQMVSEFRNGVITEADVVRILKANAADPAAVQTLLYPTYLAP